MAVDYFGYFGITKRINLMANLGKKIEPHSNFFIENK